MSKQKSVMALVESQHTQIAAALPSGIDYERIVRMTRTAIATNDLLGKCQPRTVLGAVIECAQLGLEPGITGHLVPFYDSRLRGYRAQLIADYRGLMALARRSAEIGPIYADVVRDGEDFDFARGTDAFLRHRPDLRNRDNEVIAAYAVAQFKAGGSQFEIVPRVDLDKVRNAVLDKIKEASRKYSPWVTSEPEMQKKTAVRRLCKFLPFATEDASLQRAIVLDEAADRGEQRLGATIDMVPDLEAEEAEQPLSEEAREALSSEIDEAQVTP